MAGRGRKSDTMSAVYAAASGLYPVPTTRQTPHTATIESKWQPTQHGRFDEPFKLRTSEGLPELLEALYDRNKNWSAIVCKSQPKQCDELNDDELYAVSSARRR